MPGRQCGQAFQYMLSAVISQNTGSQRVKITEVTPCVLFNVERSDVGNFRTLQRLRALPQTKGLQALLGRASGGKNTIWLQREGD